MGIRQSGFSGYVERVERPEVVRARERALDATASRSRLAQTGRTVPEDAPLSRAAQVAAEQAAYADGRRDRDGANAKLRARIAALEVALDDARLDAARLAIALEAARHG
ncbi:hypothetical protein [Methylobacterium sp. CCH5-D2]|uniref:hypothetical protein n=1 Tax=Methylobacterium sp. CCH5-D2 TaxID=1768765 RepID=UPI00082B8CBD|nr:hypothetical protein [Methylobacterium sp. CCH5-D2]